MADARRPRKPRPAGSPAPSVRVLLVDDHEVVRQGLRTLLEAEPDIAVVGEARDGRSAVAKARAMRPDVVVMDVAMPHLNGLEATRQILKLLPATRVLVLSAHGDEEYVREALAAGAVGYVLKQSTLWELANAIRTATREQVFLSAGVSGAAHPRAAGAPPGAESASPVQRLTLREAEVLQLVAEGLANKQTAKELGISVKTVEKHRQSLMSKLDIHDVAGLTHYAISHGIVICPRGRTGF